jgi:signal transduction histidine kinase
MSEIAASQVAFAQHLRASVEAIIQRWREAVCANPAVPSAQRLSDDDLTDHLPPLLECIALSLEGKAIPELEAESREHGSQRRRLGYDIAEVLREHAVLRQTLLDWLSAYAGGRDARGGLNDEEQAAVRWELVDVIDRSGQAAASRYHEEALAERRALEEALEAADHRKDEFLALVAHELRNPLAVTSNALHVLRQSRPDQPAWARALNAVDRQVRYQVRLVDDLLDISRIIRGKIELRTTPLDLVQLVRQTADDTRGAITDAGLTLNLELPDQPVPVEGDPIRLSQVLTNLLVNAIKFTDPGGAVTVSVASGQWAVVSEGHNTPLSPPLPELTTDHCPLTTAVLTVRDTGIGIAPEMLPHVFEPFTQVEGSRERSQEGLGLGLSLVKGLVELHGGQVRAESAGIGHGSAFILRLPIQPPAPAGG